VERHQYIKKAFLFRKAPRYFRHERIRYTIARIRSLPPMRSAVIIRTNIVPLLLTI
jgi:hypothetical protein